MYPEQLAARNELLPLFFNADHPPRWSPEKWTAWINETSQDLTAIEQIRRLYGSLNGTVASQDGVGEWDIAVALVDGLFIAIDQLLDKVVGELQPQALDQLSELLWLTIRLDYIHVSKHNRLLTKSWHERINENRLLRRLKQPAFAAWATWGTLQPSDLERALNCPCTVAWAYGTVLRYRKDYAYGVGCRLKDPIIAYLAAIVRRYATTIHAAVIGDCLAGLVEFWGSDATQRFIQPLFDVITCRQADVVRTQARLTGVTICQPSGTPSA